MLLGKFQGIARKAQAIKLAFASQYFNIQGVFEMQLGAGSGRFAGPHLRQHFTRISRCKRSFNQYFDLSATVFLPQQPRMQYPRVVDHE